MCIRDSITYSNNKIVPVKDAGDHIKDPVVKAVSYTHLDVYKRQELR